MNINSCISKLCLVVASMLVISGCTTDSIKCTLKGEVIDRPQSSRIILYKQNEDPRIHGIDIPIVNGKFEYVLNCKYEEQYELAFNDEYTSGSWRPVSFFSERGVINFTLHPTDRFNEDKVEGSKLTREYWDYSHQIFNKQDAIEKEFLTKSNQYLEDNFGEILNKHETFKGDIRAKVEQLSKDGIDVDPVIQVFTEMEQSLHQEADQEIKHSILQYIKEHPTIVGYSILVTEASSILERNRHFQENNDITPYADLYRTVFAPKFPNHPYSEQMEGLFAGLSIRAGAPFVDFITSDLSGKPVKLSDRITGKPAVLHLWASWCGPCRKKGKELIPVYEEFHDKGFVVIGVAREKSISTAEAAIKSDKYPWENLVELNDTEKIWAKYGIENSGGSVFLIDEKGVIVAINPSIEEIRNFLINKL